MVRTQLPLPRTISENNVWASRYSFNFHINIFLFTHTHTHVIEVSLCHTVLFLSSKTMHPKNQRMADLRIRAALGTISNEVGHPVCFFRLHSLKLTCPKNRGICPIWKGMTPRFLFYGIGIENSRGTCRTLKWWWFSKGKPTPKIINKSVVVGELWWNFPSLKLTTSHLTMNAWNPIVSFWVSANFQVRTVSFRGCSSCPWTV